MSLLNLTGRSKAAAWSPISLVPLAWFRADTLTTSGSDVTSWTDKSGNGLHATVTTGASPTVVSSVLNSQPIVRFVAASNQWLQFGGTSVIASSGTALSLIVIAKGAGASPAAGFSSVFTFGTAHNGNTNVDAAETLFFTDSGGYPQLMLGGGDNTGNSIGVTTFNFSSAFKYLQFVYNGGGSFQTTGNWNIFANSSSQTVSTGGATSTVVTQSLIGAFAAATPFSFDGDIAEIILCPTISGGNQTSLDAYILSRYGLA